MTPKEKAEDLLEKMNVIHYLKGNGLPVSMHRSQIKQCAIVAAKEMLEEVKEHKYDDSSAIRIIYWFKVIKEIEKL